MKDIKIQSSNSISERNKPGEKDGKLKKACQEFESVFTQELLKSMRKTIDKCDLFHGGQGEEIYESMLDMEMSKATINKGINGLANMLYQQLTGNNISKESQITGINNINKMKNSTPQWPIEARISSKFGWRKDPFTGKKRSHTGIDLAANSGTKIGATLPGRVLFSDYKQGYGNTVILDHGNGLTSLYGHNSDNMVSKGDWVEKGTPVAKVGSSGRSTGPHLHFEVRQSGKPVSPVNFLGSQ
jgi:Rod binding domain-containing protein